MKYVLSIVLAILLPVAAVSEEVFIPLESLIKTSDLIVIGTLRDVEEKTSSGIDYGTGEITVDEVLKGSAEPGQRLSLTWQNTTNVVCPRVSHDNHQNRQAIWLLTSKAGGEVSTNNSAQFVLIEKKEEVLKLLHAADTFGSGESH